MAPRDFEPGGPLEFSVKDLEGSVHLAGEAALDLLLTETVLKSYRSLVDDGHGRLDHSGSLLAYEKANSPHVAQGLKPIRCTGSQGTPST